MTRARTHATRREIFFAVGGAIGTAILALVVAVAAPLLTDAIRNNTSTTPPAADRPGCRANAGGPVDGEQYLGVFLSQVGEDCWQIGLEGVNPGDKFDVLIEWRNWTGAQVDDATIRAWLPKGVEYVPGTSSWHNAAHPDGVQVEGDLFDTGINVGSYAKGANAYVRLTARMSASFDLPCGLAVTPVGAQLPTLKAPLSVWVTAGIVTNNRC